MTETTEQERRQKMIPKDEWILDIEAGQLLAGIYEFPENTIYWVLIPFSELPNDLISLDDLKRHGIPVDQCRG